ncbi:uncharacterized protein TRUGW13939_03018 [Talaromyces rugulosus]|uniref:Uncharacterized protein n=1 Tax=Talaromyces rugulosus TaxID=121627 RepID=A0A7H8QPX6_TALRU|nr:uncharacterized protein TRUGW13939_03018 [Talaromyces rugulosus]QKX55919.1 hypothetical protein TRUGW13939_03018 [Talaromyces rugulosus]
MVNPVWGMWIDKINNDVLNAIENDSVEMEAIISRASKGISFLTANGMAMNDIAVYLNNNNLPRKDVYAKNFGSNPLMPIVYDLQSDTVWRRSERARNVISWILESTSVNLQTMIELEKKKRDEASQAYLTAQRNVTAIEDIFGISNSDAPLQAVLR